MSGMSKMKRSLRCHLKHGTRCPHIERHSLRRPRKKKRFQQTAPELPLEGPLHADLSGRHVAH